MVTIAQPVSPRPSSGRSWTGSHSNTTGPSASPVQNANGYLGNLDVHLKDAISRSITNLNTQYTEARTAGTNSLDSIRVALADALANIGNTGNKAIDRTRSSSASRGFFDSGVRRGNEATARGAMVSAQNRTRADSAVAKSQTQSSIDKLEAGRTQSILSTVAELLAAQTDSDIRLASDGLLVDGGDFKGKITMDAINAFLATL